MNRIDFNEAGKQLNQGTFFREYCCPKCGLIFLAEYTTCNDATCPECGNYKRDIGVIAVDSLIYAYSHDEIEQNLNKFGKKIHYAQNNPINN